MHVIEQPASRNLYAESWLIVWSTCWFALSALGVVVVLVFGWPWLVAIALPVFLISQGIAIAFAFRFRCPACDRRFFVQGFGPWHPDRKILFPGIASWIAIAFDIARHQRFICLHCGEKCAIKT
jgi:hypothetical protein